MALRRLILLLLSGLSITTWALPTLAEEPQERCARMRLGQTVADAIGYSMKRMKIDTIDIPDSPVVIEPRMAGLRGPNVTMLGRDVRLSVTQWQTSPQELWHKSQWNKQRLQGPCNEARLGWKTSIKRGFYSKLAVEQTLGLTNYHPTILHRTRLIADGMLVRPYGFIFGASLAGTLSTNTGTLFYLNDPRDPVRRDMARFSRGASADRLYASWHATPATDLHVGITAGYLEEMYAGAGAEAVWRPWNSPFWVGADGWHVWRRDADSTASLQLEDDHDFTGHVRAGYDVPDTRYSVYAAAGKYLAGDKGATVGVNRTFDNGARIDATMTWTGREEYQGFFKNTQFDPVVRVVWPLGGSAQNTREARASFRQVGRDGGQMLDRPIPLETMTEAFSTREVSRNWPNMFNVRKPDRKKEAAYIGGL